MKTGRKVVLRSEAEKQTVGRVALTGDQIKNAPATFGDALNALTTLPGVARPDVLLGQLVIRGTGDEANRYFVDGIPIPRPQHFGGLHSVLNNDFVREANIYASAFPVAYGGATGAVLEFTTIDEVDKFGAVIDVGLVSANFLLKAPWSGGDQKPDGYWVAAARVGYLPLIVPPVYEAVTGRTLFALPQYYDYQAKGKLVLDDRGAHSLTLLALGSLDTVEVLRGANSSEEDFSSSLRYIRPGSAWTLSAHSQGIYYDYEPSRKARNRLLLFNTLAIDKGYFSADYSGGPDSSKTSPNLAGIKNHFTLNWLDGDARLGIGLEYYLYYFSSSSNYFYRFSDGTSSTFVTDLAKIHHMPAAYIENKFRFSALRIVPGVRADYLAAAKSIAVGPRGLIGYDFSTGTTLELAGGVYQAFPQVNIVQLERQSFSALTNSTNLEPEEAVHRSLAVLQKYKLWEFKLEGYWNNFYRQLDYVFNTPYEGNYAQTYASVHSGLEFSLRKQPDTSAGGDFFGWASYTLSRSRIGEYLSQYDQTHNIRLVAGYLTGIHSLSLRADIYSGFPYVPVIGSQPYPSNANVYQPIYDNNYSAHFPVAHRISVRYGQERIKAWGSWRWYIEVVNATNYAPLGDVAFNRTRPYQEGENPTLVPREPRIPILPNFGVEIRF